MKQFLCAAALALTVSSANALEMDNSRSTLNVVSVKNDRVAELFTFDKVQGSIDEKTGKAVIEIHLDSISTGIDIRNERMRKYLFNTDEFKAARFSAEVDIESFAGLAKGEQRAVALSGDLSLHGKTVAMHFQTLVTRLESGDLSVVTAAPSFIDLASHDLVPGIEKLRSLAGLNNISLAVPVTFSVVFQ